MPRKLFAAISQIVLGALIAIAPQTFAHVCAIKDMPMACRYTARVALGLGVVIALLAIIGFFAPSRVRAGLDIANAVLGVLVVLVPTMLVGVCRGSMMHCHMVTMPTLIVLGVLLAVLSIALGVIMIVDPFGTMETLVMAIGVILIVEGSLNLLSALYTVIAVKRFLKLHPETQSVLESITGEDLNGDGVVAPDVTRTDAEATAVELDHVDESATVEQEERE